METHQQTKTGTPTTNRRLADEDDTFRFGKRYASESAFTKAFKRVMQATPSEFRGAEPERH